MNAITIENFRVFLRKQNYSDGTIAGYIRAVRKLREPPVAESTDVLIEYIDEGLELMRASLSVPSYKNARSALHKLFFWLTNVEIKVARKQIDIQNKESGLLQQYRDYCSNFLHLTPVVTDAAVREVKLFLLYVTDQTNGADWSAITADDVIDFLTAERSMLRVSSLGVTVTAIRRFFRFLQYLGIKIHTSILSLPLSTPDWKKNGLLPKVLSESDYAKLENYEFPDTPCGYRDRAILLCFIDLGLRCSEVSKLMLSDIRWNEGSMVISKTKTHYERELPISKRLGEALENYVISYRPNTGNHLFFQSNRSGCKPVITETVRSIIRRVFEKVGIDGWWVGTHAIRRSVGSRLHNVGNGLKSVSDLLGHKSINTSKAYVRVDVNSLRCIADTWPGKEDL